MSSIDMIRLQIDFPFTRKPKKGFNIKIEDILKDDEDF